ncbi:MAG: AmmeMemoRadiSam system radical SAM enzyme [Chlorobiaceae bacterium]|nr:AmmeMemoRadiSam system radical SAM enzyme [Chlorobiaceae bacterium]
MMMSDYPARYWHSTGDGRLQCDLCPRNCILSEGQRGVCFARMNSGNRMLLTTYGGISSACVDPIEKKPLNHFYPGTGILSIGTIGCNLACRFCQNSGISRARDMQLLQSQATPDMIAHGAVQLGCISVAFTYNDPVIFAEYAMDAADASHALGLRTVAVTAGYINAAARRDFFSRMDAANIDLKAFTDEFYVKLTGTHLQPVLDTLRYVKRETAVWLEITTLVIPGWNDSDAELTALAEWICRELGPDVPIHFSAFTPSHRLTDVPATPVATLLRARDIALRAGLHYVYTGNVDHSDGATTFCPACKTPLIMRDSFQIREYRITITGNCSHCGATIAGRFDPKPGDFGNQRIPISFRPANS